MEPNPGLTLLLPAVLLLFGGELTGAQNSDPDFWKSSGKNGAVAAGTEQAAKAGIKTLKEGGNAIDAAVATLLTLSVTHSDQFCFGGEVPILIYDAKRDIVEVIGGQGVAPRLATLEFFLAKGGIPEGGDPTTAAVPGALDACLTALERSGTMTFGQVVQPALAALAVNDQAWSKQLATRFKKLIDAETAGNPDRASGLRRVADYFYRGPIARELDAWSRQNGGLIRYVDLATHVTRIETPISATYRGHTIYKCGPWTQGPFLLETLNLLEGFDLRSIGRNSPDYVHLVIEAMKLALADRDTYLADPNFVRVPLERLISKSYASLRRPLIDPDTASLEQRSGDPWAGKALLAQKPSAYQVPQDAVQDTSTCVVADRFGNVVAATPSGWGGVLAGDTGILLGSRLRSFNTWKGHPNCIEPGKRPRITLTPTLVFKNQKPVLAISVAGGDWQDQVTLQLILNHIEFELDPAASVTADRFGTEHLVGSFNQPSPKLGSLSIYKTVGEPTVAALKKKDHKITIVNPPFWHPVALSIDPESGLKRAAGDPHANRHALAY